MKKFWCGFLVFLLVAPVLARPYTLFREPLGFTHLSKEVLYSKIFYKAQTPNVKVLNYLSTEKPSNKSYSRYQIRVVNHLRQLSYYQTIEVPVDNNVPEVRGEGIGFGGIVSLAYQKGQTKSVNPPRPHWPNFIKKFQIFKITNISGKLFPLKVGNKLILHYAASMQTKQNSSQESGEYIYDVISKRIGYQGPGIAVPGPVYVIKLSKKTNSNSLLMPMNVYWFSTKLNWYVQAQYFSRGKVVAVYKLLNWT